jgi:hypothetical protein
MMADYLYNQGGVTIDANGRRTYADGSTDQVPTSMLSGLANPSMGTGIFTGINMNGGMSMPAQNYENAADPFTVGYGTPNPSAGNGQWNVNSNVNPTPSGQSWTGNASPYSPTGSNWTGNASPYPAGGGNSMGGAQAPSGGGSNPFVIGGGNSPQPISGASPMGKLPMTGGQPQGGQPQGGYDSFGNVTGSTNPYLQDMGNVLASQMTSNFNRNVLPQVASRMAATGGFGGSRQGVIEANAMNDLNNQIGGALTNLYGQGYQTDRSYDLGLRGNDLGYANLDAQIAQNNFNNQLTGANFGLGLYDRLQVGNQAGLGAGTNIQNTPMDYWQRFGNQYNSIGQGFGTQTSQQQGNPFMGALGGAQLGSRIGSYFGNQPNVGTDQWVGTDPSTWFNTGSLAD